MPGLNQYMQETTTQLKYDAIVFDLDGTLADTFPTVLRIFNRLMSPRMGREWNFEELVPYFGPPETVMFRNIFPEGTDLDEVSEEFYRLSREDGADIRPFGGIREIVDDLRKSGVRLGVYSGATTEAARIRISHAGMLELFEVVLGGDQVNNYKPHPEGLIRMISHFGVEPKSVLYIGDMVADIDAGRGAGAMTAAVTWGAGNKDELASARPDFIVENPDRLREIIF